MKPKVVDLRHAMSNRDIKQKLLECATRDIDAVILIGHGTRDGKAFMDYDEVDISKLCFPSLIMFHACDCGRHLISNVAKLGPTALGYTSSIYFMEKDDVPRSAETVLSAIEKGASCVQIVAALREEWYGQARELYRQKEYIRAAIINHCRLSIRCREKS